MSASAGLAAIPASTIEPDSARRTWITLSVMLATVIQALDMTIANVALPHMQGTMGATQDQISWVLTSYIVASAIFMPLTGFVTARWGRKRVVMGSIDGFTLASMLCGAAQSLPEIVDFVSCKVSLVPASCPFRKRCCSTPTRPKAMARRWRCGVWV